MIEQTGESYTSSKYAKALCVSNAKVGKTTFLTASALGILPWQKMGGVVQDPKDLHVITFDSSALGGFSKFATESCNAPKEALGFNVYNFQDDARRVAESDQEYDGTLFNALMSLRDKIASKSRSSGVPVVLVSSLTGLAFAFERSIMGPPGQGKSGKGYGDQSKWQMFAAKMIELQNRFHVDQWHCLWEGHVFKPPQNSQNKEDVPKETLQISGKAGANWPVNVEQIFRVTRLFGQRYMPEGGARTNVDNTYLDTKPAFEFLANGRGFNESLNDKEYDLTAALKKLGLKTGHWGAKEQKPKASAKVA